ncbi:S41 family peptidase [bacterium]|nr:S41 family peptidase [bacterium]
MKNSKGFNLISVIIIICITSVVSAVTAGIIVTNNYNLSYSDLSNDKELTDFIKAYSNIINNYYEDVDKEKMLDSALNAMLNYLGDNYTTYLTDEQRKALEESLQGTYQGIGVEINKDRVITKVTKNGPAEAAGLQAGDKFMSIDGTKLNDTDGNAVGLLIRGTDKKAVDIVVDRNGEELTFNVKIGTIEEPAIVYGMQENNIGYIQISKFSRPLTSQMENALKELEANGMEKLIIDLRNNTGGYLDSAETTASLFLKKGKLIYSLEDKNSKEDYYDQTETSRDYPIVVLINNNSASSAEILAAALKDSYGAVLVGQTSYGKGKVQQTYDMKDGSMAKFTSARWLRPTGDCIDKKGIKPDFEVAQTTQTDENGEEIIIDTQLVKALEVIGAM